MFSLDHRDARPIYEQIRDGLRRMIVTGALAPDEKLPSVRALAMELAINPNTIQRAYAELETEGYTYSDPAKGNFSAQRHAAAPAPLKTLIERQTELLTELHFLEVPLEAVTARVEEVYHD